MAEAWSILSKPDNRTRYDLLRNAYLGLSPSTLSSDGTYISSEPVGFSEMKNNYTYNIQRKAGGSREDTQEKLRSEKWHNLPLKDKKVYSSSILCYECLCDTILLDFLNLTIHPLAHDLHILGVSVPKSVRFWFWPDQGSVACRWSSAFDGFYL